MKKYTTEEAREAIEKYELYWRTRKNSEQQGEPVDFTGADLSRVDLSEMTIQFLSFDNANLDHTSFEGSTLFACSFSNGNLKNADFYQSGIESCHFDGANLSWATFMESRIKLCNFDYAFLKEALFSKANVSESSFNDTIFWELQCPEEGSFVGFMRCLEGIVKILIPEDAKRVSGTNRTCRTNKAQVLEIQTRDGEFIESGRLVDGRRLTDSGVVKIGDIIEVENFQDDRWDNYSNGILFYITRNEVFGYCVRY